MITIGYPSISKNSETLESTISYPVTEEGKGSRNLSFTVAGEYAQFLDSKNADGALVVLLPWIARNGGKVRVLPALSPKLFYFGVRLLSHILTTVNQHHSNIEIVGDSNLTEPSSGETDYRGTGGSLGVDSLSAIAEMSKAGIPVTHLFHNNCGSHWGDDALKEGRRTRSKNYAESNRMEFVWMDSTLYEFYGDKGYIEYWPILDAGSILILNGLFKEYWIASSYHIALSEFGMIPEHEWGEMYLFAYIYMALETEYTRFHIHGLDLSRSEKTAIVADFPAASEVLNVCLFQVENCGDCLKCRRTVSQLFLLGKLEQFSNVFDLTAFRNEGPVRYLTYAIKQSGLFQEDLLGQVRSTAALSEKQKRQLLLRCLVRQPKPILKFILRNMK